MAVVPKSTQLNDTSVAQSFFELTFGALSPTDKTAARIFSAFLAISSLGNIIVMTFTAARVKQEIAKESMIPWPKFFAQNYDFSLGRVLRWARRTEAINRPFHRLLSMRWLLPENHSEHTPVGALLLHLVTCLILLLATYTQRPQDAYFILTGLAAYVVNGCFGTLLAAGIIYLRFTKKCHWRQKAERINPVLSVVSAIVYFIGNLFPVVTTWVKPSKALLSRTVQWFIVPTASWCVLAFAGLWWVGLILAEKRTDRKTSTVLKVQKVPEFESDPPDGGLPVQVHETVYLCRVGKETLSVMGIAGEGDTELAVLT
jgi:amino acid transporter